MIFLSLEFFHSLLCKGGIGRILFLLRIFFLPIRALLPNHFFIISAMAIDETGVMDDVHVIIPGSRNLTMLL